MLKVKKLRIFQTELHCHCGMKSRWAFDPIQGRRNEFELTGAKNRQLVNSRQGEEKFWSEKSYFYYKVLRLKDKSPQKLRKSTKLD